ncbi:MAG: TM0106 family RecB-like putative nuclease [Kiritimatiellae bacterium]|nr:TM0106 family RecB-like putative nuclease [Kiritimatiellia bacterium]
MRLTASDIYSYYRPSRCTLRPYLKHKGVAEAEPGAYVQLILRLGERHEQSHLASLGTFADLRGGSIEERQATTLAEIKKGASIIYQGVLKATESIKGLSCEVVGIPDFMIPQANGTYAIRDSKMSRRITEDDHPEILRQLRLYGWLYERNIGRAPAELQVHSGTGQLIDVVYDHGKSAWQCLHEIAVNVEADQEPYEPVGWSKCDDCGFKDRCWGLAEKTKDVALVEGVDQGLSIALRRMGIKTYPELLDKFNVESLSIVQKPHGAKMQRVGKKAESILRMATALARREEIIIEPPAVPRHENYVMFDLEGLPPQMDEIDKIYLWGMQVFGQKPGAFLPATSSFGEDGDREGWERFLTNSKAIFEEYGDIPFVHWASYEKTNLDKYVQRYGDEDGIAARVRTNLLDLLPITKRSVALPLPSYGLKVIEKYVGFKRTQEEYGGDWSMAKYIEAIETHDDKLRAQLMNEILTYNNEDLQATWAVLQWLLRK